MPFILGKEWWPNMPEEELDYVNKANMLALEMRKEKLIIEKKDADFKFATVDNEESENTNIPGYRLSVYEPPV